MKRLQVRLEFKPQDAWIGVFVKRSKPSTFWTAGNPREVWICLVPMLPLHIAVVERKPQPSREEQQP